MSRKQKFPLNPSVNTCVQAETSVQLVDPAIEFKQLQESTDVPLNTLEISPRLNSEDCPPCEISSIYRNNKLEHTIESDPSNAALARRMFELYASGQYSLASLRKALKLEFGKHLATGYLARLLKNPFYNGAFYWEGKLYPGTQTPLISKELFERTQAVFQGHNKPKQRKHQFAFGGLLRCAYDDCAVTAEIKKNRYTYYRCTGYRGKCELPYFREEEIGNRLGEVLKKIHIPDDVLLQLQNSLLNDTQQTEIQTKTEIERLNQRLGQVRNRIEQSYVDKLDGKISEEFWSAKSADWTQEEQQILFVLQGLKRQSPDRLYDAVRTLELANKVYFLYLKQQPIEQANCSESYFRTVPWMPQVFIRLIENPSI